MELKGKVIAVLPVQSGVSAKSGNTWATQECVIEMPGQYPKKCCFKIFGEDRIKQYNVQPGQEVTIHIDIDAHEHNGRWFNSITAYNVATQVADAAPAQQATIQAPPSYTAQPNPAQQATLFPPTPPQGQGDNLPF